MDAVSVPTEEAPGPRADGSSTEGATAKQIRGSSLLLVGKVLSMVVFFAVQVIVVRYLSKEDYGAFAYALSFVNLGQSIALLGLDRAITRFVPIYEERRDYAKMLGTIVMVAGTVVSLGLALILLVYGLRGTISGSLITDRQAVSLLLILIVLAPIQALDTLIMGMFAVFSRPRSIFFRKYLLEPGLRLAVVLLLVLGNSGVRLLAFGYVASGFLGVAIFSTILIRVLRERGLLEHFDFRSMKMPAREVFAFTIPVLTSDLVYLVMNTSDVAILGHYGGVTDVAAFRVVQPAARLNQLVFTSFALLFTPLAARMFARDDKAGINELYWTTAIWIAILTFPIFALTFSLARPVTTTLYSGRYAGSALYLSLLALAYYFNAALGFNGLTLKVFGKLRYIVTINVLAALVNLGINLLLIPRFGPLGAAIGTTSTLIVFNVMKQAGLRLGTGVSLFHTGHGRIYLAIALSAAILLAIQVAISPPFLVGFALAALASLLVLAVGRHSLQVGRSFPELMRFRLIRLAVGHPEDGG